MGLGSASSVSQNRNKPPLPNIAAPFQTSAPINGLNTEASIFDMDPKSALSLRNLIPRPYGCQLRPGRSLSSHSAAAAVQTLIEHPTSGNVYAITNGKMFEVSSAVDFSSAGTVATSLNSDLWYFVTVSNSAGTYLVGVSEHASDEPLVIDSSGTVTRLTRAVSDASPTGWEVGYVDPETFCHVVVHQRRLWFVTSDTGKAWYFAADAIAGVAVTFDFGPVFVHQGGFAYALGTWSTDQGDGPDDLLAVFSAKGDMVVYQGTDPASASTWSIIGSFFVGRLANRRSLTRYGGELVFVCEEGVVPMSKLLARSSSPDTYADNTGAGFDRIQSHVAAQVRNSVGNNAWQLIYAPFENLLVLSCPAVSDVSDSSLPIPDVSLIGDYTNTYQLAMDTILGGWGELNDLDAKGWCIVSGQLWFGTTTSVFAFGAVEYDQSATSGGDAAAIEGSAIQAFSQMGAPGLEKYFSLVRASVVARGQASITASVNVDYDVNDAPEPLPLGSELGAVWDTAVWDAAVFGGQRVTYRQWSTVGGVGTSAAPAIKVISKNSLIWASTEAAFTVGGIL